MSGRKRGVKGIRNLLGTQSSTAPKQAGDSTKQRHLPPSKIKGDEHLMLDLAFGKI
jgi:hypothetical protein